MLSKLIARRRLEAILKQQIVVIDLACEKHHCFDPYQLSGDALADALQMRWLGMGRGCITITMIQIAADRGFKGGSTLKAEAKVLIVEQVVESAEAG